jgi:hypothetical protein
MVFVVGWCVKLKAIVLCVLSEFRGFCEVKVFYFYILKVVLLLLLLVGNSVKGAMKLSLKSNVFWRLFVAVSDVNVKKCGRCFGGNWIYFVIFLDSF